MAGRPEAQCGTKPFSITYFRNLGLSEKEARFFRPNWNADHSRTALTQSDIIVNKLRMEELMRQGSAK